MLICHRVEINGVELEVEVEVEASDWWVTESDEHVFDTLEFGSVYVLTNENDLVRVTGDLARAICRELDSDHIFADKVLAAAAEADADWKLERAISASQPSANLEMWR